MPGTIGRINPYLCRQSPGIYRIAASVFNWMPELSPDPLAQRSRLVAWALSLTANTALAPGRYERQLLHRYEQGNLTLDQVLDLLTAGTYQLLYRSHATAVPTPADLQRLLDQARAHNATAHLTGLLVSHDGQYVQILEGSQGEVQALYARILRDPRHTRVVTLSEGLEPTRHFPSWRMGLGNMAQPAVARLTESALTHTLVPGAPSTTNCSVSCWKLSPIVQNTSCPRQRNRPLTPCPLRSPNQNERTI